MDNDFKLLVEKALFLSKKKILNEYSKIATIGCALLTEQGYMYTGINIDVVCGIGFCAEHSAIAEMLKHNETRILKIVSASDEKGIRPPCGRCRELIRLIDSENFETLVMIEENHVVKLADLLPYPFFKYSSVL
jgi:cytidine deaminase